MIYLTELILPRTNSVYILTQVMKHDIRIQDRFTGILLNLFIRYLIHYQETNDFDYIDEYNPDIHLNMNCLLFKSETLNYFKYHYLSSESDVDEMCDMIEYNGWKSHIDNRMLSGFIDGLINKTIRDNFSEFFYQYHDLFDGGVGQIVGQIAGYEDTGDEWVLPIIMEVR